MWACIVSIFDGDQPSFVSLNDGFNGTGLGVQDAGHKYFPENSRTSLHVRDSPFAGGDRLLVIIITYAPC